MRDEDQRRQDRLYTSWLDATELGEKPPRFDMFRSDHDPHDEG